jgi:hypothetical protein
MIHALIKQQWCFNEKRIKYIVIIVNYLPVMKFRFVDC